MDLYCLYALRLGFSTGQASKLSQVGLTAYVKHQLKNQNEILEPDFLKNTPKSLKELRALKLKAEKGGNDLENVAKQIIQTKFQFKAYYIERLYNSPVPLREKINLFFQNHFVATLQGVNVPYWIFQHYKTINQYSLANYKDLVKAMLYTNAMVKYLDNQQNRKGRINENLARELLELFTLGEGQYSENDIRNVARALAGLTFGEQTAVYRPLLADNGIKTIFGKSGNFDANGVVDLIFEQPNVAYHITEKVLKWFFYDEPTESLIDYYANYLKLKNFELQPFFEHLLIQECEKGAAGTQIKNPLTYIFQIYQDLNLTPNYKLLAFLLNQQGMDIYNQPNVKGWIGGNNWLSVQIYANRKQLADFLTNTSEVFKNRAFRKLKSFGVDDVDFNPKIKLVNGQNAQEILKELAGRTLFQLDGQHKDELSRLLPYDFYPKNSNAQQAILNVYNYLIKTPEFQIV